MCGIVGMVSSTDVSYSLYYALYALQHRGQDSAGIVTTNYGPLQSHRGLGLVASVFDEKILAVLTGTVGIGHVRYPTTGLSSTENVQPFSFTFKNHHLALAHNGNITNYLALHQMFEENGQSFLTTSDTEVIAKIIIDELSQEHTVEDAIRRCMRTLEGSYSVVLLLDGCLHAFRDPYGFRPLCLGHTKSGEVIVASESAAIDGIGGVLDRDIMAGEMITVSKNGDIHSVICAKAEHTAHCIFEYIYFARSDSIIDGALVYDVRRFIGSALADEAPADAEVVCTVPDSGTAYAVGYSERSTIPFVECLIKNRYMGRTFIIPTQETREKAVRIKLNPIPAHLDQRSIVLVDDSIVRGTTSCRIVDSLRKAGAAEIHMRIGSPIIKAPCYFGVDMPTHSELIGSSKDCEGICEQIQATSLHYASLQALVDAIGISEADLCTGCITSVYPYPVKTGQCHRRHVQYT